MSARRTLPSTIRTQLLGIVLLGAVLPLALIGFWLTRSAVGSGEALLDQQLATAVDGIKRVIAVHWEYRAGELQLLAVNDPVRHVLTTGVISSTDSEYFAQVATAIERDIPVFVYRDTAGREIFSSAPQLAPGADPRTSPVNAGSPPRRTMNAHYPVHLSDTSVISIGTVDAQIYLDTVIPSDSARILLPGAGLAVRDRSTGAVLVRLSESVDFPTVTRFKFGDSSWMVQRASIEDPPFDLAVAAPVGQYATRFERDGRIGLLALAAVALLAVLLSNYLTSRLATSFGAIVDAADAVAAGDLTREVEPGGPGEFHRLAKSFNTMTESLRRLVAELSERRAMAAVGEFAASLSHEVRNALTAIQIDLERVDERTEDAKNRTLIDRSLVHVRRLDAAVTGSLRIARSGRVEPSDVFIADVLDDTVRVAEPSFTAGGGRLNRSACDRSLVVRGDAEALHQLFLNLLLNAQQALAPGGEAQIGASGVDSHVVVVIMDTGRGMTGEQVDRAFDPYYTTRAKGTGLGLPIARQIAAAHGGTLTIESVPEQGTRVEVRLPMDAGEALMASGPARRLPGRETMPS